MNSELISALKQIEREKGISMETLILAIEQGIGSAYKKEQSVPGTPLHIMIDRQTGKIRAFLEKLAVEQVADAETEISLDDARKSGFEGAAGEPYRQEIILEGLGRIATLTAKQVVVQKIREAERDMIYDEFKGREGDIVTGIVSRQDGRNYFVDLGKVEAILPSSEQVRGQKLRIHQRCKFYVLEARKGTKGSPHIVLSRTHPNLVRKLFEFEIPEIQSGIVEIKALVRDPGNRTKVAVWSKNPSIDAKGACLGNRGSRLQPIMDELEGEKIDIVRFKEESLDYIQEALYPAKFLDVNLDDEKKHARILVADSQLSLAIGRSGQNVKLASRLVGWRIDITSESRIAEEKEREEKKKELLASEISQLELCDTLRQAFLDKGLATLSDIVGKTEEEIASLDIAPDKISELKTFLKSNQLALHIPPPPVIEEETAPAQEAVITE